MAEKNIKEISTYNNQIIRNMIKEYYQPEIEDLKVGYECGWLGNVGLKHKWFPVKMSAMTITNAVIHGIQFYRTPYLTKEQIIAEGWDHEYDDFTFGVFTKDTDNVHKWYYLDYDYSNHGLSIDFVHHIEKDGEIHYTKFVGECKCINTLRYISKLLKIK